MKNEYYLYRNGSFKEKQNDIKCLPNTKFDFYIKSIYKKIIDIGKLIF